MNNLSYILSFTEGILTFISPCILPMLPIYFFYLAGSLSDNAGVMEKDESSRPEGKSRLILNSLGFVIGFTIVFVTLGATATTLGHFLKSHLDILRKVSGALMVLFGLNFMGILKLSFLNVEKRIEYGFKELKFLNSIVFGMVFGFGWTPCLTAFLGSVLLMAGNSGTMIQGILLLLVYSIGLGMPFLFTAVIFEKAKDSIKAIQRHSRIINIISGIVLILAGVLTFTDKLKYLGTAF